MTDAGDALNDLFDDLFVVAGFAVQVTREDGSPVSVDAVRGRAATERFGDEGFHGTSLESDFIFKKSQYIAQVGGLPDRFDRIQWTDDAGAARSFRVGVEGIERQWDPVGQMGILIRVHVTEV